MRFNFLKFQIHVQNYKYRFQNISYRNIILLVCSHNENITKNNQ